MRAILARYAGIPPEAMVFDYSPQGKPALASTGDCPGLRFNASASGLLALLALRRDHEVGVDVEAIRDVEDGIARRAMTAAERATYDELAPAARAAHFCALWAAKEAVVKSLGRGLGQAFDAFDVSDEPGVVRVPHEAGMDTLWIERLPAPRAGHAAAVASGAPLGSIRLFSLA